MMALTRAEWEDVSRFLELDMAYEPEARMMRETILSAFDNYANSRGRDYEGVMKVWYPAKWSGSLHRVCALVGADF